MAMEIITGDGRIWRMTPKGTFVQRTKGSYSGKEVTAQEIKQFAKYTGVEAKTLKESSQTDPHFTNMMWDKSNNF